MRQSDALRHAGRTARIEQREKIFRFPLVILSGARSEFLNILYIQYLPFVFSNESTQLLRCDEQSGVRVFNHEIETLLGIGAVEGLVCATGFQYAQ